MEVYQWMTVLVSNEVPVLTLIHIWINQRAPELAGNTYFPFRSSYPYLGKIFSRQPKKYCA